MKYLITPVELTDRLRVGGKGHQLQMLQAWGTRVAPFLILTTESHDYFLEHGKLPIEVERTLENFIHQSGKVAFRSSMTAEDHSQASFAGLFETVLGVGSEDWKTALLKVYESVQSEAVRIYLKSKNISTDLRMAVVVQQMIEVEKSGVLFTRSPVYPSSAIAIDAGLGLGEGVVSGRVEVDHYLLTRIGETLRASERKILSDRELEELVREGLRLERHFGAPVDIEWGFYQQQLYIFQIRPITRSFSSLKFFADTNLSESYPGTVSPYTAAFVKKAYENVFLESALILGASGERLMTLKRHYAQLIGSVDHHLYYDLEHYYAVLRSLPGGDKNIDDWHRMIGGKLNGASVPYHQTKLSILETVQAMASLAALAVRSRWLYPDFLNSLEHFSKTIETRISSLREVHEIIDYQRELLSRPMGFGLTVANDVFIMMGLSFLTKRIKARGYSETLIIELLKTHGELDSVKPLTALKNLVNKLSVSFIDELKALKLKPGSEPYRMAFERLNSRWPREINAVEHFLKHFGERSFEELKLESLPIKNDPELFLRLISWEGGAHERVMHPEKLPQISFNWLELKVIRFTRSCIEFRESSRLWRGRFYHFLRSLVILMAERLMQTHPAFSSIDLKDFFSLTVDEWSDFLNGKRSEVDVLQLMEGRRKWQVSNQKFPEFLIWSEDEALMRNAPHKTTEDRLQGLGVSPGVVDGFALVLDNPVDAIGLDLNQYILVTKNTDPAWVYVMSRSRGLISEKGSLLSHTAIIGRELSITTCVGVKGATEVLKTGDRIRINGTTGEIERL